MDTSWMKQNASCPTLTAEVTFVGVPMWTSSVDPDREKLTEKRVLKLAVAEYVLH
jgi:hypothetical protein